MLARIRVAVAPAADRDVVLRRAADVEVAQRDLVAEDGNAVHRLALGHDDPEVGDRDVHRRRLRRPRAVDEEDGARGDRIAVDRMQPDRAEPERDDARPVRGDRRPVARDPEAARRVALAVRELRQEDRSAGAVEPRLKPRRVVADRAARERRNAARPDRRTRRHALSSAARRPTVAVEEVLGDDDWPLPSFCPPASNDAAARVPAAPRARFRGSRCARSRSRRRGPASRSQERGRGRLPGPLLAATLLPVTCDVECRLAAVRGADVQTRGRLAAARPRATLPSTRRPTGPKTETTSRTPAGQVRVRQRDPAAHSSGPFGPGADPHVGERRHRRW